MNIKSLFINSEDGSLAKKTEEWVTFLVKNKFDFSAVGKIDMTKECPQIFDMSGNKFSIDFVENKQNYLKKKTSIKNELISRALGAGKYGLNVLDLSAGLGIDAVFLAQLGYMVTAIERNPLIYLALREALLHKPDLALLFKFGESLDYLQSNVVQADVIYFDPMFPEKTKSALPRQEMVFFRNLVGTDADALKILECAIKIPGVKRLVVKRPIKAPALMKTATTIKGKLVRFDLYQGVKA